MAEIVFRVFDRSLVAQIPAKKPSGIGFRPGTPLGKAAYAVVERRTRLPVLLFHWLAVNHANDLQFHQAAVAPIAATTGEERPLFASA